MTTLCVALGKLYHPSGKKNETLEQVASKVSSIFKVLLFYLSLGTSPAWCFLSAITYYYKWGDLTEIYSLTVVEDRNKNFDWIDFIWKL